MRKPARLPAEYQEVEYLRDADKASYIITDLMLTDAEWQFSFDVQFDWADDNIVFGYRKTTAAGYNALAFGVNFTDKSRWQMLITTGMSPGWKLSTVAELNKKYHVDVAYANGSQSLSVDGTVLISDTESVNFDSFDAPMGLFCVNKSYSTNTAGRQRIYRYTAKKDGVVVRDYIPCYRKSDNKPGMYDLMSGIFHTNAGTGEFLVGPDIN